MIKFKGSHFPKEIIMMSIRWYVAYPLSYRQIEELLAERGVIVDHATINRWVVKYAPLLEQKFRNLKKAPGLSWRVDETYIKVKGQWTYYYRAVDKEGSLREEGTLSELSLKYGVHVNQICKWKKEALETLKDRFGGKGSAFQKAEGGMVDTLYKQIGQLTVELDFLRRKSGF